MISTTSCRRVLGAARVAGGSSNLDRAGPLMSVGADGPSLDLIGSSLNVIFYIFAGMFALAVIYDVGKKKG